MGDLNSRIGGMDQELTNIDIDRNGDAISKTLYLHDQRTSEDKIVTKQGRDMLELCNKSQLVLLNGRKLGDFEGKYTCHKHNGSSVCDIVAASYDLYSKIKFFRVMTPVWFSDHCPITFGLDVRLYRNKNTEEDDLSILRGLHEKFRWDEDGGEKFKNEIKDNLKIKVDNITLSNPDSVAKEYEDILLGFASKTLKTSKNTILNNKKVKWMNKDCFSEQKLFKKAKSNFLKDPGNFDRRQIYLHQKKKYKRLLYFTKKSVSDKNIKKIGDLAAKSPNEFWQGVKKLLNDTKKQKGNHISPKGWLSYFKRLLNIKMGKKANDITTNKEGGPLDFDFTIDEISTQLKSLKTKKSASTSITNEMLKSNIPVIATSLVKIFNFVLDNRVYPKTWNISHISPLFKAGDPSEASNYRGICVGNAIGKLFNKCINKRIVDFLNNKKIIPDNSMGFRKKIQTENAMLTLNTISSKYRSMKKKVYTVFVDFSKFYDTINHDLLFQKLRDIGLFGKLFDVLRHMYASLEYTVKLPFAHKFVLTESFSANIGLKQGCPLSPTLANIFLHDIHKEFLLNDIELGAIKINSIAWADDLVIFSLSREGLQKQLKNLEKFCRLWRLIVNIDKTKCLIFSSTSEAYHTEDNFIYNEEVLAFVPSYKYLGVEFQQNGRFTAAIQSRISKARAALFAIRKVCSSCSFEFPSIQLLFTLFKAKIIPILTYGSSIWATKSNNTVKGNANDCYKSLEALKSQAKNLNISIKNIKQMQNNIKIFTFNSYKDKVSFLSHAVNLGITTNPSEYNELYTLHEDIERFQLTFFKKTLGLKQSCPSDNVRFEFGAYPLFTYVIPKTVKFFLSSKSCAYNNLIQTTLNSAVALQTVWSQGIHFLLKNLHMEPLLSTNDLTPPEKFKSITKQASKHCI